MISVAVRELCNQLRTNDPRLLANDFRFDPFENIADFSEDEYIEVFQALKENTSVNHILLWLPVYTKSSA
jgi:hypothetical protein